MNHPEMSYKNFKTCIQVLGIEEEEIRGIPYGDRKNFITKKYRSKAKSVHPDRPKGSPEGNRMKEVNTCYSQLKELGRDLPRRTNPSARSSLMKGRSGRSVHVRRPTSHPSNPFGRGKKEGDTPFVQRNKGNSMAVRMLQKAEEAQAIRRAAMYSAASSGSSSGPSSTSSGSGPSSTSGSSSSRISLSTKPRPNFHRFRMGRTTTTTLPTPNPMKKRKGPPSSPPKQTRKQRTSYSSSNKSPVVAAAVVAAAKRREKEEKEKKKGGKTKKRRKKRPFRKRRTKRKRGKSPFRKRRTKRKRRKTRRKRK